MKVTVRIGRIRVKAAQPVDAGALRRQVSAALSRTLASQSGEWGPAKVDRLRLEAGNSGPRKWGGLVAEAVAKTGRPR